VKGLLAHGEVIHVGPRPFALMKLGLSIRLPSPEWASNLRPLGMYTVRAAIS
jgi:hypothetical protein